MLNMLDIMGALTKSVILYDAVPLTVALPVRHIMHHLEQIFY